MKQVVSSSNLTAVIKRRGAEVQSLIGTSGVEYMWQADPNIWARHAPILFPVVGKLKEDRYEYNGKVYNLGLHGFARDMDFELVEKSENSLTYRLNPTAQTIEAYPFEFALLISYRIERDSLTVEYKVTNNDKTTMPFSIGAHPAFSLEWGKGDEIEDYYLEFELQETADTRHLDDDKLLAPEKERILTGENVLKLRRDMFDRDALIFLELKSKKVSLCSTKHSNRVTVEFPGFPYLGVWAKPAAPYVCIEPWFGHVDPADTDGLLMNKPGIIKLAPSETFTCAHKIVIDEE